MELLFFAFIVVFILASVVAIATENSTKCANRPKYAAIIAACIVAALVILQISQNVASVAVLALILISSIALQVWLLRVIVQRTRDAGFPKGLAYLALAPVINWLFYVYLLFPASRPTRGIQ